MGRGFQTGKTTKGHSLTRAGGLCSKGAACLPGLCRCGVRWPTVRRVQPARGASLGDGGRGGVRQHSPDGGARGPPRTERGSWAAVGGGRMRRPRCVEGTGAQRGASGGAGVWPQAGQTQRWPRSAAVMRSSTEAGIRVCMHQQVSGGNPAATAQALVWPHKGQVAGEGAADMAPVYAVFSRRRAGRGSSPGCAARPVARPIAGFAATRAVAVHPGTVPRWAPWALWTQWARGRVAPWVGEQVVSAWRRCSGLAKHL